MLTSAERSRRYYVKHRDKRRASSRARYSRGSAAACEYARQYREANLTKCRAACRKTAAAWAAANPELRRIRHSETMARRRARVLGNRCEKYSRAAIFERYDALCGYCAALATALDHIVPIALGGADAADNLIPCCAFCNGSKGSTPLLAWLRRRGA